MKIALVNPPWSFDGSIYFGCREPHLPLEYGYAQALLADAGHDAAIFDAQMDGIGPDALASGVGDFAPDMIIMTTAPSYLFWRCAPPELRVPQQTLAALSGIEAVTVAVGPHASSPPAQPTFTLLTKSSCPGANSSKRWSNARLNSASRRASIYGARTCSTFSAVPAACRSRPASRA